MRPIKFRGQCLDNGEWIYGDLCTFNGSDCEICDWNTVDCSRYDIDPETVGQFTGLLDKNGVEIFEGDIIAGSNGSINGCEWPFKCEIKWNDAACEFNTPNWGYMDSTHYFEIVGNIHDNPELLKTK